MSEHSECARVVNRNHSEVVNANHSCMAAQDLRTKQFLYAQRNSEGHSSSRESPSLSAVFDFFDEEEIDVPLVTTDGVPQARKTPKLLPNGARFAGFVPESCSVTDS